MTPEQKTTVLAGFGAACVVAFAGGVVWVVHMLVSVDKYAEAEARVFIGAMELVVTSAMLACLAFSHMDHIHKRVLNPKESSHHSDAFNILKLLYQFTIISCLIYLAAVIAEKGMAIIFKYMSL